MKAKFVACASVGHQGVWLKRFLYPLGVVSSLVGAIIIYCDNQSTIAYTKNPKYHWKTKHFDTKYNFTRDIIEKDKVISLDGGWSFY